MLQHIKVAMRGLVRTRGVTAAAVACLALGIGATTLMFSVVHSVLLQPLGYRQPDRLVRLYSEFPTFPNGGLKKFAISRIEYLEMRRDLQAWETLDGWQAGGANLAGAAEPVRVNAVFATGSTLRTLGVQPLLGRVFTPEDDRPTAPQVAVLSESLWRRSFGADPNVLGRDARLDGRPCTIVGVMPNSFEFPAGAPDRAEIWVPFQIDPGNPGGRGNHILYILGRLKEGVSPAQAQDELKRYVERTGQHAAPRTHTFHPVFHPITSFSMHEEVVGAVRPAIYAMVSAVGFVLLIACVNVANLLLARAEARQREVAVRKALGAERLTLFRQFATEGLLLSLAGAAAGLALTFAGLRGLRVLAADAGIPRAEDVGVAWQVLLFALAIATLTGVIFGLAPLAQFLGRSLFDSLKSGSSRTTASVEANRLRRALAVGELALALVLLIGTGLMVRAFWKLQAVHIGLNAQNLLTLRIALPSTVYPNGPAVTQFWGRVEERMSRLPGVVSATLMTGLPPARPLDANDTGIQGFVPRPGGPIQNVDFYQGVGRRFFETLRIPLAEGRYFDDRDGAEAPPVIIVNQTMARTFWPGQSALGRRVRPGGGSDWRTVVGVVADVKNSGVDKPAGTELFIPIEQTRGTGVRNVYLALRTTGEPLSVARAAGEEIRSIDRSLPVADVRAMEDVVYAARSRPRFLAVLLTAFAAVALALAAIGIYGVISYSVAQRTNEFGIRMAMGAGPRSVLGLVLGQGLRLGAAGVALGALGALALTRFLRGLLFGIDALDPLTFVAMAAALGAVTLLACYLPARRATRVDPMVALRYE